MHPPILGTRTQHWRHESDCESAARALAALPPSREALIELRGALGAGKSTFARHLLRALGVGGRIKSPSYAIVETYETADLAAAHLDFYRFDDPDEWEDSGLRELFAAPGLKLVEWPEKAAGHLPRPDLRLWIEWPGVAEADAAGDGHEAEAEAGTDRVVRWQALSERGLALLDGVVDSTAGHAAAPTPAPAAPGGAAR